MTLTNSTVSTAISANFEYKPVGLGQRWDRRAHALARRLRIPWVRRTRAEAQGLIDRPYQNTTYSAEWTSDWALSNATFSCGCAMCKLSKPKFKRKGKKQHRGRIP